ncbi:MAG: 50S ribosomal protein L19 [Bdellovibrionales bacterium]|nr:50S ribosomal protein L19 [Bdellovibrionales bacterium]
MQNIVQRVTLGRTQKNDLPQFNTGDTLGVYVKVKEGEKERVQLFKGIVIKIQNSGQGRSFTVRKMSSGVGVERTFPFTSPALDRIEIISKGKIRRSRLFYLRGLRGRAAKIESNLAFESNKSQN